MNCTECKEFFVEYINELLDESQKQAVSEHLKSCQTCRALFDGFVSIHERLVSNSNKVNKSSIENKVIDAIVREQNVKIKTSGNECFAPKIRNKIMKSKLTKLTAAAIIMISVIIGLNFLGVIGRGGIVWADVIKPIFTAKTAKFDMIIGNEETGTVITDLVKGSRINRTMAGLENTKIVIDLETSQVITFDQTSKTVTFIDLKNLPQIPNYLEHLRNVINKLHNIPGFEVKNLGEKNIDGIRSIGFQGSGLGLELVIWADAQTAYPVRIEQQENNLNIICKNFQFDPELNDSLFSTEVPPDYKEQKTSLDLLGSTEEDCIAGLRMFAEISEGKTFPPDISIEYITNNAVTIGKMIENLGISKQEQEEIGQKLTKMAIFLRFFNVKNEGQWHYAGAGVKLGEADKAIFWYQPKGSATYRIIYGDLHVENISPDSLPQ